MPWNERLRNFFEFTLEEDALLKIMEVNGCREGWIQGELFKHFHFDQEVGSFFVNTFKYPVYRRNLTCTI